MSTFQQTTVIGHLGRDPETRYTPSGTAVTSFSLATSERWRDKTSGEQMERTTWFNVEAWGKLAELCGEYLQKGARVHVVGRMRMDEWEKDGEKQRMWKLRIDTVTFLESRGEGSNRTQKPATTEAAADPVPDDFDDDIPF